MAYTSLKDLYSENVVGKPVPPLPRQRLLVVEQANSIIPGKIYNWTDFNLQDPTNLFNYRPKDGMGRGEYSLACILYGVPSAADLDKLEDQESQENKKTPPIIQGKNATFDILGPNGEHYEVKEIEHTEKNGTSVLTGNEGKDAVAPVKVAINKFLDDILSAYSSMDENGRIAIDSAIKASQVVARDILSRPVEVKHFNNIKDVWTLDNYIKKVRKRTDTEISSGLLFADRLELWRNTHRPEVIFSFKQLAEVLTEISGKPTTPGNKSPSIKDIYDTIVRNYRINADDVVENEFFEKEAENIDRAITQQQCARFKKCTNQDTFKAEIGKLNPTAALNDIAATVNNILPSIFPGTGLFIVDPLKFMYIPRENLKDFIEVYQISMGTPKIRMIPPSNSKAKQPDENI